MSDGGEFVELLWENGQAVVHGRKKHPQPAFPPFGFGGGGNSSSSRGAAQERHLGGGGGDAAAVFAKTGGGFGGMGMVGSAHDFGGGFHAAAHDNGDDDTVPWIHYPIIDDDDSATPALAADYCSDFFSELQAAAAAASAAPTDLAGSLPPSNLGAAANHRSAPVATGCRELTKESRGLSVPTTRAEPQTTELAAAAKQHRPGGTGVMNFSLFSRPAAMARASLQRPQGADKASNATGNNRMESTVVQAASVPRNAPVFTDKRAAWPPQQPKEVRFAPTAAPTTAAAAGNLHQELARDKVGHSHTMAAHKDDTRKAPDATVTTSSVCSGNGVGIDEPWHQQKRKSHAECSASQDEDLDDDYGGALRRSAAARGTKRSRTAEVHNLSERRRRDRINEKMRALQELIPNCNKIDKASMLDEAIEYLKTLQLQVQMMSMGTGLCIPPMLLPPALQHLQIPPMAHFPHLAMGLGYGMGVFDMNHSGGAIPIPPMPGAHFPYPMMPGAAPQGFGIRGTNTAPMFGIHGQTIPSSSAQPFASVGSLPLRPNMVPQVSGTMSNMVQHQQQQGTSNQQQQCLNKEATQGANTSDPQMQIIMQGENQHFRISSSEQTNSSQFSDGSGKGATLHGGMGLKHKVGQ